MNQSSSFGPIIGLDECPIRCYCTRFHVDFVACKCNDSLAERIGESTLIGLQDTVARVSETTSRSSSIPSDRGHVGGSGLSSWHEPRIHHLYGKFRIGSAKTRRSSPKASMAQARYRGQLLLSSGSTGSR